MLEKKLEANEGCYLCKLENTILKSKSTQAYTGKLSHGFEKKIFKDFKNYKTNMPKILVPNMYLSRQ